MKFKTSFLLFLICFLFSSKNFGAAEGQGYILHKIDKSEIEEALGIDNLDEQARNIKDELFPGDTRFIFYPDPNIEFSKTAFYAANYFYLGAQRALGGVNIYSSALMRAYVSYSSEQEKNIVNFLPLAPERVFLNGETEDGRPAQRPNPIYNNPITNLVLMGQYPVVTLNNPPLNPITIGAVNFNADQLVCLVDDIEGGTSVKTNTEQIKDAAGNDTAGVAGLAASWDKIFAAVRPQAGGNFGQPNSGFAMLSRADQKLQQVGNQAFNLNLNANQLLAIDQNAQVGGFGDMYWDSTLQRLFIGLRDVRRTASPGGAISILVGRLQADGTLQIEPAVALNRNYFYNPADPNPNKDDFIFGFYYNAAGANVGSSTYKIRTMHTSTGKSYLIVNGGVAAVDIKNRFYALPIIKEENVPAGVTSADIGKVASKNNLNRLPAAIADMSKNNEPPVILGGGRVLNPFNRDIQDMFVVADSVYVCVAEGRDAATREAGIFRSTAIFGQNGNIRAWTPWQRVMGNVNRVYGAGLDTTNANYWYLTTADGTNVRNTVKVTQWGKSEAIAGLMGNGLVSLLNEEFKQENGGVHQIFNFDEKTPSLARNTPANELSIMVATGFEKVAIIKSGSGTPFTQENQFTKDPADPNRNVFVFDNDDTLKNIGPICCVDVSRVLRNQWGWLFVGGYGGLGVLRDGAAGTGWDGDPAGAVVNLPTISGWTFKELKKADNSSFSQVRKIVCEGETGYLYVMTAGRIYRIQMGAGKFSDAALPVALQEKIITPPSGTLLDMIIFHRAVNDTRLLVATTEGLFYSNAIVDGNNDQNPNWTRVNLDLSLPVSHLNFVSTQKGGFTTNGNLYALAEDFSLNLANIYRFDIQGGAAPAIIGATPPDYFYSIGEFRHNFVTDGTFGFSELSKHFGKKEFLRKINIGSDKNTMRRNESVINLDLEDSAYNVGIIVQNTASGAWIVPGDWGIRAND